MIALYDGQGQVELVHSMGSDNTPAHAARVSFARDQIDNEVMSEDDEKLIRYLAKHKHMSPFEHVSVCLRITCPIYIGRQIMRHRTFSYNEISRRYTSRELRIHTPDALRPQAQKNLQASAAGKVSNSGVLVDLVKAHNQRSLALYEHLLSEGVAREQARMILPHSTLTSFWMSGNLRNWAHFLSLRMHEDSQPEAQELAQGVACLLRSLFPISLDALLGGAEHED